MSAARFSEDPSSTPREIVFVVHGDATVRRRLCELIASEGLRAVSLGSALEFALTARAYLPACVILDAELPDLDPLELQQRIAHHDVSLVFVTRQVDLACSVRAIKNGAINFLGVPLQEEDLLHAVHTGIQQARRARESRARLRQLQKRWSGLSRSERKMLPFILSGLLNKQVALALGTSPTTIQTHRSRIMQKMAAGSSSELVRMTDALNIPLTRYRNPSRHTSVNVMNARVRNRGYYLPALGRWLIAAIFLISGVGKLFAPQATQDYIVSAGLPAPTLTYFVAILVEIGGGIFLALGYRTRLAALVMALFTLATALGFHAHFSDPNQMTHFLKNIAITGGLLQVVAFGAGSLSLDRRSGRQDAEFD